MNNQIIFDKQVKVKEKCPFWNRFDCLNCEKFQMLKVSGKNKDGRVPYSIKEFVAISKKECKYGDRQVNYKRI